MQKQYKYREEMDQISLSDSDRARILSNVLKAYEESADGGSGAEKVVFMQSRPRFSPRRMGLVAAGFVALVAGAFVIHGQFIGDSAPGEVDNPIVIADNHEVEWMELESIDDIEKMTDCKTYTLSNIPKSYKVNRIEVANAEKHVKIKYREKKHHDQILLEYKEGDNSAAIAEQFEGQQELTTEKVGDKQVTMYGEEDCDAMTWQEDSCTFAVKMTKSVSKAKAVKLVSGTKEKKETGEEKGDKKIPVHREGISEYAVGWDGTERETPAGEKREILEKVFDQHRFRVMLEEPAKNVTYKIVDNFESFCFEYPEEEKLKDRRVVGYAGRKDVPDGVLDDFIKTDTLSVNGVEVQVYADAVGEEIYLFTKQEIRFLLLPGDVEVEDKSSMLSGLMSVLHISLERGHGEEGKPANPEEEDSDDEKALVAEYQAAAKKIQDAVADESLSKLAEYISFPLTIQGLEITVGSASELEALDPSLIFTSQWVDQITCYDPGKIRSNVRSITMGSDNNFIFCKAKNKTLKITEMAVEATAKPTEEPEEEPTPSEE